jgi:capsular exopolysaccharide synthesis family protein
MSQLFEGFSRASIPQSQHGKVPLDMADAELVVLPEPTAAAEDLGNAVAEAAGHRLSGSAEIDKIGDDDRVRLVMAQPSAASRLIAWDAPNSLGAEKFRALAVRLDAMRRQHELKSLQVTSSVISEGKSFVAANLAVTLAKYSGYKTLLIEGDLHRPTLATMFGLKDLHGLSDWWTIRNQELASYIVRFNGTALSFLPAGKSCDRPSEILRSGQLADAFAQLRSQFDWIVVDSTPMLPVIDANLWSRLVDGSLLVVREGIAPLKALKKGLQSLDNPKLIGVVVNEASDFDQIAYEGQYYGARKNGDKGLRKAQ